MTSLMRWFLLKCYIYIYIYIHYIYSFFRFELIPPCSGGVNLVDPSSPLVSIYQYLQSEGLCVLYLVSHLFFCWPLLPCHLTSAVIILYRQLLSNLLIIWPCHLNLAFDMVNLITLHNINQGHCPLSFMKFIVPLSVNPSGVTSSCILCIQHSLGVCGNLVVSVLDCQSWGSRFKPRPGQKFSSRFLFHLFPLANLAMMSTLTTLCQWEDETVT